MECDLCEYCEHSCGVLIERFMGSSLYVLECSESGEPYLDEDGCLVCDDYEAEEYDDPCDRGREYVNPKELDWED